MKYAITGSLGHISKPLTERLLSKGHSVTVISSRPEGKADIEALGATAAIGMLEDVDFLASVFAGADAVYCMLPPPKSWEPNFDLMGSANTLANNYAQAIKRADVKRVVHLSSVGAHTDKGTGLIAIHFEMEKILRELPPEVAITHMRPVGFFYNILGFIGTIKANGVIASNYGAADVIPWVSPIDIAAEVAEELETPLLDRKIRYVASDELTCNEAASILGKAIEKPDLQWLLISDEQMQSALLSAGMAPSIASGIVELNAAMHSGYLFEDYYRNKPQIGRVKMEDFAKEFADDFAKA